MDFGLGIMSFTIACVLIGGLLGLVRGQNRSILRLILVLASAVVAFMMRETLVDMILGLEVQGQPLSAVINEALLSGASLPQQLVNFINMIIEILITTIVFIIVFGALSFVTWLILFQILKIFVRPSKKGKKAGVGLLIGIVQGLVVAFLFCVPITGFIGQFAKISDTLVSITFEPEEAAVETISSDLSLLSSDGEQYVITLEGEGNEGGEQGDMEGMMSDIQNVLGDTLKKITESPVVKFYNSIGDWYFGMLTTVEDANGNKVTLEETTNVLVVVSSLTVDVFQIEDTIKDLVDPEADPSAKLSAVGDVLVKIGTTVDKLGENGERMFDELLDGVKELLIPEDEEMSPEVENAINNLKVENLKLESVGNAFHALSNYVDNVEDPEEEVHITEEDAEAIVVALHENTFILDMIGESQIVEIDSTDKETFTQAIEGIEGITAEEKEKLYNLFNLD